ncbi:MAG: DUF349 domain-containing protein [Sphingobacteriaceae bacterium]
MKTELIAKLEELLTKEAGEVALEVRQLQKEYQKIWSIEFEKAKQQFIEDGGKLKEFEYPKQPDDNKFEALLERFKKLKKESEERLAKDQEKNLLVRKEIISKIKDLSQLSENVGAAIKKLQELQTEWKETGAVSSHKYKEVQGDYSKAVEEFYYNLKIYRDLQEHDLKRNLELKQAVIEKIKGLQQTDSIKEAEHSIKAFRNEWEEIGPVPNEKWEELKAAYRAALDETYAKIKTYYKGIEEKKENNLKAKQDLIEKLKGLVTETDLQSAAAWNKKTDAIMEIQNQWRSVGRTTEKDNEKIWSEFRELCDQFFDAKKVFFNSLHEKFADNRKVKLNIIQKAEALQDSTDWANTGKQLIKLQEDWKKHPSNGDKEEPKLFARFRKACNTFFDAKKAYYENMDAAYEGNLVVKEELLTKLNAFQLSDDVNANREALKGFTASWNNVGMVPMKDKKRLNDAFYNKIDELYNQLNVSKKEKAAIQYQSKIDRFLSSENPKDLLSKEADLLKKQLDEVNNTIRTYENNLGFFKNAKGGNALLKDVEDKVAFEKQKVEEISAKRKKVIEELTKLREAQTPKAQA